MKRLLLLFILCAAAAAGAPAQDAGRFTVEVSSDSVLLGNYLTVTFTLENASGGSFQPPAFEGFDVISGPNMSSSFSMINGKTSQRIAYTYYLQPREIGNYYIEPASIEAGDRVLASEPREVFVLPNPGGIIEKPRMPASPFRFRPGDEEELLRMAPPPPADRRRPPPAKPGKKRKTYKM